MISFMITTGSLNSQDMISFMITTGSLNRAWLGILNREDIISQVSIYVMDIVWILCDVCVEVQIHGFVKLI